MHLTDEEIESLTIKHKERLKSARNALPEGSMSIADMQRWMIQNNVESPEMLETLIKKQGKGIGTGKKKMP